MRRRPETSAARRARLASRIGRIEAVEPRSMITESIGIFSLGIGVPAWAASRGTPEGADSTIQRSEVAAPPAPARPTLFVPASAGTPPGGGGGSSDVLQPAAKTSATVSTGWLTLAAKANPEGAAFPAPTTPSQPGGGGAAPGRGSITPLRLPPPGAPVAPPASPTPSTPAVVSGTASGGSGFVAPSSPQVHAAASRAGGTARGHAGTLDVGSGGGSHTDGTHGSGGGLINPIVYVLDYNDGSVMFPGYDQYATPDGAVDLRAQVFNPNSSSIYTYSWTTSGLTDATGISGTSTYRLQFSWDSTITSATTNSTTLTVTDSLGDTTSQTYTFQVPAGTHLAAAAPSWPAATSSDEELAVAPSFVSHDVTVDAGSGALDTSIDLPSYNAAVAPIALTYDSVAAVPSLFVDVPHQLDPSLTRPTQVTAQLTFDSTAGSTAYYDTLNLNPGATVEIAMQADATTLATGRYSYSVSLGDVRGSTTTSTVTGTATVLNPEGTNPLVQADSFGVGWTLEGLERIDAVSGGAILELGEGDKSLWFATSGSSYTTPAGDFSTLAPASGGGYTRTLTDGTVIDFNSSGQETSIADRNGLTTTYGYSGGKLTTITDPYGKVTTFAYSGSLLSTITDPASRVTTITHGGGGVLSGATLPDKSAWSYGYDSAGRLTTQTDPNSHAVTVAYDSAERVATITRPDLTAETFAASQEQGWLAPGTTSSSSPAVATLLAAAAASHTDPNGDTTDLRPDWWGEGQIDVETDPLKLVSTMDRDANGLATIAIDPLNRVTQYAYDADADVTEVVYPDGTSGTATYNGLAEPLVDVDPMGRTTTNIYDSHGDLINIIDPLGNTTTLTYTSDGTLVSVSDPAPAVGGGGMVIADSGGYDAQDQLLDSTDADGGTTSYTYDAYGDVATSTDPDGNTTSYTYDAMSRLISVTDPLLHTTTYGYDSGGNLTTVTDPDGRTTTVAYDAMDRVSTVIDPLGGVTTYAYDSGGRLASLTDPDGNTTTYAYDADDREVGSTDPNGNLTTIAYDADGEVTSVVDRDGRQTTYAYDALGREVGETWVGGSYAATYTYDADGELTGASDPNSVLTFTYDSGGRQLTAATSGAAGQPATTLTSTFDPSGDRTSLTDSLSSAGVTSYAYDPDHRMTTITQSFGGAAGPQVVRGYDAAGLPTSIARTIGGTGTAVTTSMAYDTAERLATITQQVAGGSAIDAQYFGYDAADQMTGETTAEGSVSYTYDSGGELTGVSGAYAATYGYDANGNRDTTGYSTSTGNELTASPGYTYTYDAEGNMTGQTQTSTGDVTTFAYDFQNRLTGVTERSSGGTILNQATYTYDVLDRQIGFDDNGTQTWTVYDGQNVYADFGGSGTLEERYLYGPAVDQILARTSSSGTTDWYLTDNLGSVRDVVSTSGTVVDHVAYDTFGNVTIESGGGGDRFKFAGMQLDPTTGLDYDQARFYNPVAGRFVDQDPIGFCGGDANLYRYVDNGPTNAIDPSGDNELDGGKSTTKSTSFLKKLDDDITDATNETSLTQSLIDGNVFVMKIDLWDMFTIIYSNDTTIRKVVSLYSYSEEIIDLSVRNVELEKLLKEQQTELAKLKLLRLFSK